MNKYQNGKIYIITSSDNEKVYLGSTTRPLKKRLGEHTRSQKYSSRDLKSKERKITLLETYPSNNKTELLWRERYWYDELKPILINKYRPIHTRIERAQRKKENSKRINDWNNTMGHLSLIKMDIFL